MAKIEQLGGPICKSKTAVTHIDYFASSEDTKHNAFSVGAKRAGCAMPLFRKRTP